MSMRGSWGLVIRKATCEFHGEGATCAEQQVYFTLLRI